MRFSLNFFLLALVALTLVISVTAKDPRYECGTGSDGESDSDQHKLCQQRRSIYRRMPTINKVHAVRQQTAEEISAKCGGTGVMEVPESEDPSQYHAECRD